MHQQLQQALLLPLRIPASEIELKTVHIHLHADDVVPLPVKRKDY